MSAGSLCSSALVKLMGDCGSGGGSAPDWRVGGLSPGSCSLHANPKLPSDGFLGV